MKDVEVDRVQQIIQHSLDRHREQLMEIDAASAIPQLVQQVQSELNLPPVTSQVEGGQQSPAQPDDIDELPIVVALCVLGPSSAGSPPAPLRADALDLVREFALDESLQEEHIQERIIDIITAYGCGLWREAQPGDTGWEHRWQPAIDRLGAHVLGWLKATAAWLHFDVQLKGYAFSVPFPSLSEAHTLAYIFWSGMCDCWRLKATTDDQPLDRRTAQRAERCMREHRLSAWNPAELSLADFLARAMKGDKPRGNRSRKKGFASGAVEQSMIFVDLYRDHDVRFGKVVGWSCPEHPKNIFEGARCLSCDEDDLSTIFDETQHKRTVVRRLLVKAPTGPYGEDEYWHCQDRKACDTYYRASLPSCPKCGRTRTAGAARSGVWGLGLVPASDEPQQEPGEVWAALGQLDAIEQEVMQRVVVDGQAKKAVAQQLGLSLDELNDVYESTLEKLKERLAA